MEEKPDDLVDMVVDWICSWNHFYDNKPTNKNLEHIVSIKSQIQKFLPYIKLYKANKNANLELEYLNLYLFLIFIFNIF